MTKRKVLIIGGAGFIGLGITRYLGENRNYDITILGIQRGKRLLSKNLRETPLKKDDVLLVRGSVENFFRMKEVEQVFMLTEE